MPSCKKSRLSSETKLAVVRDQLCNSLWHRNRCIYIPLSSHLPSLSSFCSFSHSYLIAYWLIESIVESASCLIMPYCNIKEDFFLTDEPLKSSRKMVLSVTIGGTAYLANLDFCFAVYLLMGELKMTETII